MAMKCENCGKGKIIGRQHTHHPGVAGGRWKKRAPQTQKVFKPNLHSARVFADGAYRKMKLCTKCLRVLKGKPSRAVKEKSVQSQPQSQLIPAAV